MSLMKLAPLTICLALVGCSVVSNVGEDDAGGGRDAAPVSRGPYDECGNGMDDDGDGMIDEGCPCGLGETQACFTGGYPFRGVGLCADGMQACDLDPGIEFGTWGACTGDRVPAEELCDGTDSDCDGAVDEGCPCTAGQTQGCGLEFVTEPCRGGTQTCTADGVWTSCEGAIGPSAEVCDDAVDNDCDGNVNEGCDCIPVPEVCGDAVDNDCDGVVDEPACGDASDAGAPVDAGVDAGTPPDCSGLTSGWVATSLIDAPAGRLDSTIVWTGSEVIIWGGNLGLGGLNDGRRFDPRANDWSFMTNGGAPSARRLHGTVWTGSEMIVWGGLDRGALGDGALYDPVADSWRPMTAVGAPSARLVAATVWTGSEMIVWGGSSDSDTLSDGAIYDPVADSWRPLSAEGAPGPRTKPDFVWTGSELIIWGGRARSASSTYVNGAVYTVATDSWRPISTVGAPEWRYDPALAWTGSEMALWGGRNVGGPVNNGYVSTGYLYSPSTDRWRPMSNAGAPEGRTNMGFAWTGEALAVWGGESNGLIPRPSGNLLSTGAFWDAATDTWSSIDDAGAPVGRWSGSWHRNTVWTGCSLIVWGGVATGGGGITDTGGVFTP